MPIYEFECPKCGNHVTVTAKYDDPAPLCCEENCSITMERVISVTSFTLKGGGWAKDGYSGAGK